MLIRVRVKYDGVRRKVAIAKAEIKEEARGALLSLAAAAVDLTRSAAPEDKRRFLHKQVERQLDAVFIPVALKHERREQWPNLGPIYQARIVRHQSTYQGRKLFYVDEHKRAALAAQLIAIAMQRREVDNYEVRFVATYDKRFRVEIVRKRHGQIPPAVIAFARQNLKYVAAETIARALSKAGLSHGTSTTRYSHRFTNTRTSVY